MCVEQMDKAAWLLDNMPGSSIPESTDRFEVFRA